MRKGKDGYRDQVVIIATILACLMGALMISLLAPTMREWFPAPRDNAQARH